MNKVTTAERSLKIRKSDRFLALKNLDNLKVFVLLAITIWIAYFWHSASFGIYSGDFRRVGYATEMSWSELGRTLQDFFLMKIGEGRPLHDGLIYLGSFIGFRLGGLHVVYWIAYAILTVNSFLFYTLLKRLSDQQVFAVTGALTFCLFPALTVKAWLTFALGAQTSLMLLLIAIHCYLSNKKKWSYLLILGSLLCYETFFPLFLAAPLLKQKWNSKLTRELIKHGLILAGMLTCLAILRKLTGDVGRLENLELLDGMKMSIQNMYVGPIASLKSFVIRPLTTLKALVGQEPQLELWIFIPLCFAGFFYVLSRLQLSLPRDDLRLKTAFNSKVLHLETTKIVDRLAKLASVGIIMWALAYPLSLIDSPNSIAGEQSRLHLAGSVGASIFVGCIFSIIFLLATAYGRKHLATVGLAAYLALLVGFGLIVQQHFQLAWQYQQQYWTDAISLIPDLDEETVILVDRTGFRNLKYVSAGVQPAHSLTLIYDFPDHWKKLDHALIRTKRMLGNVYTLDTNWQEDLVVKGNSFQLDLSVGRGAGLVSDQKPKQRIVDVETPVVEVETPKVILLAMRNERLTRREVETSKVILLEIKDGQLTRRTEPLVIGGKEFPLKEKTATGLPPFEKGPLYDYLIKSPDEERVDYIQ